jgi:hypothetical protein
MPDSATSTLAIFMVTLHYLVHRSLCVCVVAKPPKGGHSWGLRNIPRQKVLNSLRDDGSLMVLCEIELIPDISKVRLIIHNRLSLVLDSLSVRKANCIVGRRDDFCSAIIC